MFTIKNPSPVLRRFFKQIICFLMTSYPWPYPVPILLSFAEFDHMLEHMQTGKLLAQSCCRAACRAWALARIARWAESFRGRWEVCHRSRQIMKCRVCKRDGPLHGHGPFKIERLRDFYLKYSDMRLGVQKYTIENTETTVVNKKDNIPHIPMCQQFYCIWICSTSGQGYDQHMGENLRKTVSIPNPSFFSIPLT